MQPKHLSVTLGSIAARKSSGLPIDKCLLVTTAASSLEAAKIQQHLYREAHPRVEPTETMRDFVAALKREWPGLPGDPMAGTPWKYLPLEGEAAGSLFDTVLTFSSAATAVPRIARLAEERGLVFFDPQFPKLRVPFRAAWER